LDLEKIIFRNSDNDNEIEARHTHSGREFKEVHVANLFKKNYGYEDLYKGQEADLTEEEHSEPVRAKEGKTKEPR
jgi:hypothetical protein